MATYRVPGCDFVPVYVFYCHRRIRFREVLSPAFEIWVSLLQKKLTGGSFEVRPSVITISGVCFISSIISLDPRYQWHHDGMSIVVWK